ncbi:MAG: AMP-binding protein [Paramuribaculum sp.]|nr:AMP-binding protein [Paramuribaculum sp.]
MTYDEFYAEWRDDSEWASAHTSGSTGQPKPVRLAKADMRLSARATIAFFGIKAGDLLATPLAADYIAGKMMAVRADESGARLHVEEPSRFPLATLAAADKVRLAAIVPQQIPGIVSAPCAIDHIIVGGAPCTPEQEREALAGRPDTSWWATYGMTETCSHVALRAFGDNSYHALPGVSLATDPRGCLIVKAPEAGWSPVVTNDIVDLIDSTTFIFRGRADNVIISGGIKIHPEEVERVIAPALDGRKGYVRAVASEQWGSEPQLVVESTSDTNNGAALLARCDDLLTAAFGRSGHIMRPKSVIFISRLPLTSTGKLRRL